MKLFRPLLLLLFLCFPPPSAAQETRVIYLSGEHADDAVLWDFRCSGEGRKCGSWTRIPVPSQWEQQGFGNYNYGHDEDKADEIGEYRTRFHLDRELRYDRIDLVFGGVMTDTEVKVNGELAGPVHRGGFYPFRYDVTRLVRFGEENLLEVTVHKKSADRSVEDAERDADYWVFGGIYRPVRIEAVPPEAIDHVAYDARHDGSLRARIRLRYPLREGIGVRLELEDLDGERVGTLSNEIPARTQVVELEGSFPDVRPWSAERPELYVARLSLVSRKVPIHRVEHRIGFRTVEVREGQGLFVNDRRVVLKGVNRHAFRPSSGRALSPATDYADARRIKSMHMNAVRLSHYPPDPSFLDACDEVGLYVLGELAGWHDAYDTDVGRRLVRSMVERDVNHPSIVFWNNGNEDGWNTALDGDFALHDPQARRVLHPRSLFEGIDTMHYLTFDELQSRLDPKSVRNRYRALFGPLPLVMPTEILHGLYDGGSGAGLGNYWRAVRESPRGMGLFLWAFTDEAIERSDRDFELDTDGNHAPDGILGPYRETSGNEWAVREVFRPVAVEGDPADPGWDATLRLENRFSRLDLSDTRIYWWLLDEDELGSPEPPSLLPSTTILRPPPTAPGEHLTVRLPVPEDFRRWKALHVRVVAPPPNPPVDWRRPLHTAAEEARTWARVIGPEADFEELADGLRVVAGDTGLELDGEGNPRALVNGRLRIPFPLPHPSGQVEPPRAERTRTFRRGRSAGVETRYEGRLMYLRWQVFPSGWIRLSWQTRDRDLLLPGLVIPFDLDDLDGFRWIGLGPTRVWGNREHGTWGSYGTSARDAVAPHQAHEPQLRGYYLARRATLETPTGQIQLALEEDRFLGLGRPLFPGDAEEARAEVHSPDGLAFLDRVPSIGTKFHPPEDLAPSGEPERHTGLHRGAVWIYPGPTPEVIDPLDLFGTDTGEELP